MLLLMLAGLLILTPGGANPDLWGHVQYGKDVFAQGLPATTTYSYTAEGYRWINHENLTELLFAQIDMSWGGLGLQMLRLGLAALVVGILLLHFRRHRMDLVLIVAVTTLVLMNLRYHWSIRPQLFTYTFFLLMILLVDMALPGWAGVWNLPFARRLARAGEPPALPHPRHLAWLWLSVPMMGVWANTHGGFVAGVVVFLALLGGRAVELLAMHGRAALLSVVRLTMLGSAAVLASFINPYSLYLHGWLVRALRAPRPEITEWHGLSWNEPFSWLFGVMVATALWALVRSRRPIDATHLVAWLLIVAQSVLHRRHIAFATLAFAIWFAPHLQDAWRRLRQHYQPDHARTPLRPTRWTASLHAVGCLALVIALPLRLSDIRVPAHEYPIGAVQFILNNQLGGRLMVTFNWAQYVLAALCPDQRVVPATSVAFDGRFRTSYPQEVIDLHFDFILGDLPGKRHRASGIPYDPNGILTLGRPELVLVNRKQPHSLYVLGQRRDEWSLLYQDGMCQLWGRASVYDDPSSPRFLAHDRRIIKDDMPSGCLRWPGFPQASPSSAELIAASTASGESTRKVSAEDHSIHRTRGEACGQAETSRCHEPHRHESSAERQFEDSPAAGEQGELGVPPDDARADAEGAA